MDRGREQIILCFADRSHRLRFFPATAFSSSFYATFFAALIAAHLFFAASEIALRPAALIFRFFGFAATPCVGSEPCLSFVYLARCARAILLLTAALRFFRGFAVSVEAVACVRPPSNMLRISAIRESMWSFCTSNPAIAAMMISGVSFCGMS
jgi:hypothetical protein